MDTDETGQPGTPPGRRRARTAAVVAAAVLAIPGGVLISNAVAASGDGAPSAPSGGQAPSAQTSPYGSHRGDCPGKGDGERGSSRDGESGSAAPTGYALQ